jgi:hypothetical protein
MPAGTSLTQQRDQRVALIQSGTEGDFYFGIMVDPKIFLPRRILDPDDNQMCYEIEEKTRGAYLAVHLPLSKRETLTDGVWDA